MAGETKCSKKYVMDEEFINIGMKEDGTSLLALDQNGDIVGAR